MEKEWKINAAIDCQTTNILYKLSCRRCPPWAYIGVTSRRFTDFIAEHRSYVCKKLPNHPVGQHFNARGHDITDLIAIPIEKVLSLDCP